MDKKILGYNATTAMKGIAIVFVLLSHLKLVPGVLANIGVAVFFILSGFGLTESYKRKGLQGFVRNKILKVWVPYFIVTVIWILVDYIIGIKHSIIKMILNLLGLGIISPIDPTMWYVSILLMWYVGFYLVFNFKFNYKIKLLMMSIAGICLFVLLNYIVPGVGIVQHYSLAFPIGIGISVYYEYLNNKLIRKNQTILSVLLVVITLIFMMIDTETPNLFTITFGALAVISVYDLINIYITKTNFSNLVGKYSYELYLIEGVFIFKYGNLFNFTNNRLLEIASFLLLVSLLAYIYKVFLNRFVFRKN